MRADADFMVYVGARWPSLLREAVLLGCPPELAAEATTDALARCRRGWERASREEDVDQLVRGELAVACARRPRGDTSDEDRREQAERLVVLAPPSLDELRAQERVVRVRTAKRAALVLVPVLLVAAGLTWWTTRGDEAPQKPEPELSAAALVREENPAGTVTWWANGELHLDHVVLAVAGLRDMTRLGSGAVVYGDDKGRVVYIADDGARTVLGHKDPLVPVAATHETGLAAWYDPDSEEVVAVDAASGDVFLRTGVGDRPRVVAVDGDVIYLVGQDGSRALLPTGFTSEVPVSPAGLLDVRSRIRAFQVNAGTIQVVQSYFNVAFDLPGNGARLSPDGNLVATRLPGTEGQVAVYDTRSGAALPNALKPSESAVAAAPGDGLTIAYVVSPSGLTLDRELQLRTCDLRTTFCQIVARFPNDGSTPVLAR